MDCGDWIEIIIMGTMLLILLFGLVANKIFDNRYKELIGNEYKIQIVTPDGTIYPID